MIVQDFSLQVVELGLAHDADSKLAGFLQLGGWRTLKSCIRHNQHLWETKPPNVECVEEEEQP